MHSVLHPASNPSAAVTALPCRGATLPLPRRNYCRPEPRTMNTLLEPAGAPSFIPDLMLVDDEDACTDAWAYSAPGLASFAPLGASSAPVPIAAPAVRLASPSDELVDSLESTQTMLGASLHDATMRDDAAARMHFVPIPVQQPAQPQPYLFQQQLRPHMQHRAPLAPADEALYGGYGAVAHVQQAQPTHVQPVQQGWSTQVESSQLAKAYHAAGSSGISAFELQHGYSTQFGQGLAIPSAVSFAAVHPARRAHQKHARCRQGMPGG